MEILRDSIWQFVGVAVAVLALVVAVAALLLQEKRKSLSVTIQNFSPIIGSSVRAISNDLLVTYKGQTVTNLAALTLAFANDGGKVIATDDFESPISVTFKGDAKILTAEVVSTTPSELAPIISHDSEGIIISPLLLNPRDTFSITLLLQGLQFRHPRDVFPNATARIKGVSKVSFDSPFIPIVSFETPYFGFNVDIRLIAVVIIAASVAYLFRVMF